MVRKIIHLDTFEDVTLNNELVRLHAFLVASFVGDVNENEPEKSRLFWLDENHASEKLQLASSRLVLNLARQYLLAQDD